MPQPVTDSCVTCKAFIVKTATEGTCHQDPPDWKFNPGSTSDSTKISAWPPVKNTEWCMQYKKN